MKTFTLQKELEEWLDEEKGEGEFKDFSFWANTDKGSFDSEKGAMTDYKIYAKNNITDEVYEGKGGYYTNNGHSFNYPVEFKLQVKKEKKVKNEFIPVKLLQDESSHWYIIPQELWDDWEKMEIAISEEDEDSKEWYKLVDEFCDKFNKYRTGGGTDLYQLYISQEEFNKLIH